MCVYKRSSLDELIIGVESKIQSLVSLNDMMYEAGLVNDTNARVAPPDGHVGCQDGPGVGLGAVHLHTGQVTGPVITSNHVESAVVSDNLGLKY